MIPPRGRVNSNGRNWSSGIDQPPGLLLTIDGYRNEKVVLVAANCLEHDNILCGGCATRQRAERQAGEKSAPYTRQKHHERPEVRR
jgi:hypothetical protein